MLLKTRKITQGAMIAAMFGVLSLLNTYTAGTFDIIILYIMVLPLVYYDYHNELKDTLIVSVASLIVIFITGVPYFIVSAVFSCAEGLYIGECLKKKADKKVILLGVILLAVINNILLYQVLSSLVGINIAQEMTEEYKLLKTYIGNSVSLSQLLSLIPLVIVVMGVLEGYLIILICSLALGRLHIVFPQNYHISNMHMSKTTGLLLLVMTGVGIYGYKVQQGTYYEYLFIIGIMAFILQGLAFVLYVCINNEYPRIIQFIASVLIFIPFMNYLYGILGLLDIFLNLRGNYGK